MVEPLCRKGLKEPLSAENQDTGRQLTSPCPLACRCSSWNHDHTRRPHWPATTRTRMRARTAVAWTNARGGVDRTTCREHSQQRHQQQKAKTCSSLHVVLLSQLFFFQNHTERMSPIAGNLHDGRVRLEARPDNLNFVGPRPQDNGGICIIEF